MGAEEELPLYRAGLMLWKVVPPIFLVFGIFGNILTIIVLTNKRSRNSSTSLFLAALALSDLLALLTGLVRQWVRFTFDYDVRSDVSVFGCKLHWFIVYFVTQFSSWMLICVTVERVISTWMPHIRAVACRVRVAIIAIGVIFAFLLILNLHFFYGYGDLEVRTGNTTYIERCAPLTPDYYQFAIYQWTWIDLCIFYLIPVTVLIVGNSAVIYKVFQSRRRIRPETGTANVNENSEHIFVVTTSAQHTRSNWSKKIPSLTLTLVLVSSVFIACITPVVVYPIGLPHWSEGADGRKLAELFFGDCLSKLIMYVNHTVNFLLYFMGGSKFRREVKRLLLRKTSLRNRHVTQFNGNTIQPTTLG